MTQPTAPAAPHADPAGAGVAGPSGPGRARPLPPDERRAALIAATIPLVAEHGTKVTTRQIAEAACVAEGTIFRVFPDKEALIHAAAVAVLDPQPMLDELAGVDVTLPLRVRLLAVTAILQQRLTRVFNLMIALRMHGPPDDLQRENVKPANELVYDAVARVLEPDRDAFRCPVGEVTRLLRLITFSGTHPLISDGLTLSADEIVSVLLDGVLRHDRDHA